MKTAMTTHNLSTKTNTSKSIGPLTPSLTFERNKTPKTPLISRLVSRCARAANPTAQRGATRDGGGQIGGEVSQEQVRF